jgi:hypothetical protein
LFFVHAELVKASLLVLGDARERHLAAGAFILLRQILRWQLLATEENGRAPPSPNMEAAARGDAVEVMGAFLSTDVADLSADCRQLAEWAFSVLRSDELHKQTVFPRSG